MHASSTSRAPLQSMRVPQLPMVDAAGASPAPPSPPAKYQRGEDGAKLLPAGSQSGISELAALPLMPLRDESNPWAHMLSGPAIKQQARSGVKREAGAAPVVRTRACLIPPCPEVDAMAENAPPPFHTAHDLLQTPSPCLSLGDAYLDAPLRGGLREGITELVGESACGKTQFAMQAMLQCQLPVAEGGLAGGALFLAAEDLPMTRLRGMAESFKRAHASMTHDMLSKVFVKNISNVSDLLDVLLGPNLRSSLTRGDVKLIVLDSIAAIFRTEHGGGGQQADWSQRSRDLLVVSAQLQLLSSQYHVPVLVTNQVSDFMAGADANGGEPMQIQHVKHSYMFHWSLVSSGRRVVPALGLTWANCVTTRIFLNRKHEFVHAPPVLPQLKPEPAWGMHAQSGGMQLLPPAPSQSPPVEPSPPATITRRFMHLQLSPLLPPASAEYVIETAGIRGVANIDDLRAHVMESPQESQARQASDELVRSAAYAPQHLAVQQQHHEPFFHHSFVPAPAPAASSAPYVGKKGTFTSNMFTPSYFEDDDVDGARTAEQDEQELAALEQAEALMRARQQAQRDSATLLDSGALFSPQAQPPMQQPASMRSPQPHTSLAQARAVQPPPYSPPQPQAQQHNPWARR